MKLDFNLADFDIELDYTGWGLPLTVELFVNQQCLLSGPVTDSKIIKTQLPFTKTTPIDIELWLKHKTYAHTDQINNKDHTIEIKCLTFLGYNLLAYRHHSVYLADLDCENPDPLQQQRLVGASILGQPGCWRLTSEQQPFFTWYHKVSNQGVLYDI